MYTENINRRELLTLAMPFVNLTKSQWDTLLEITEEVKLTNSKLYQILEILKANQARIEIMADYFEYYGGVLDRPLEEENKEIQIA